MLSTLTRQELDTVLLAFADGMKQLFGDKLKGLVLYGSYARGDYDEESDIDVMALVDASYDVLRQYRTQVSRIADKADWDYDTLLSPMLVSFSEFEKYKDVMPFYRNVRKEVVETIA